MSGIRVLLVEDDEAYARLLREILSDPVSGPHVVERVSTLETAMARLERGDIQIVLLDLGLPDADGLEALERLSGDHPHLPIVVLSGQSDLDTALSSMRTGAQEYLVKGQADHALLPRAIRYAIERKNIQDFEPLLLGIVGHDLRNPLQTIALASDRLLDAPELGPESRRHVERIVSASDRAASLVRDLLDSTRVRLSGEVLPIQRRNVDSTAAIRQVVDEFRAAHGEERLVYAEGGDGGPAVGAFDADRIQQVVANLLRNAFHHGAPGRPVEVRVRTAADVVELTVRNDGDPIPADVLPHVFDPLRQARGRSRAGEGIGLGLFIVREIVDAHQGRIAIASSRSQGTTVTVVLPRAG